MRFKVIAVRGSVKLPPRFFGLLISGSPPGCGNCRSYGHPGTDVTFARFITIPANCEPRNWATTGESNTRVGLRRACLRYFDSSRAVLDDKLQATLGNRAKVQHSAHTHPDDRVATVISGTWYIGYGAKFD